MIQFALVIITFALIYKAITRGTSDADVSAAGIVTGLVFSMVQAFAFIAGGWWSAIGYAIAVWAAANFCVNRLSTKSLGSSV